MAENQYKIELSDEAQLFIRAQIDSGNYASADDVLQDAIALMQQAAQEYEIVLDQMRKKIARGVSQCDAGETVDGPRQ